MQILWNSNTTTNEAICMDMKRSINYYPEAKSLWHGSQHISNKEKNLGKIMEGDPELQLLKWNIRRHSGGNAAKRDRHTKFDNGKIKSETVAAEGATNMNQKARSQQKLQSYRITHVLKGVLTDNEIHFLKPKCLNFFHWRQNITEFPQWKESETSVETPSLNAKALYLVTTKKSSICFSTIFSGTTG